MFLLAGLTVEVVLCLLSDVDVHSVNVLDAETGSKDCYLHLLAKVGVESDTPLYLEVGTEALHEIVHFVHFLHHKTVVAVVACCAVLAEVDAEKNLLGVEYVVVVEQRRIECILDSLLDTALALAVAC